MGGTGEQRFCDSVGSVAEGDDTGGPGPVRFGARPFLRRFHCFSVSRPFSCRLRLLVVLAVPSFLRPDCRYRM